MEERSSYAMTFMIICGVVALLLYSCTPRAIYSVESIEHTKEDNAAVAQLVIEKLDPSILYDQFKSSTLPSESISSYILKLERSAFEELALEKETEKVGETAPWIGWMFFAGLGVLLFLLLIFFLIGDSNWWQAMVRYWDTKAALKKQLNKEQVKTLKEVVRIQNKILNDE